MTKTHTEQTHYQRIAIAIEYLNTHFKEQPSLEKIASVVNLSPSHFQRLFSEWAGVSPKQFIQYLSIDYARQILKQKQATLIDTAHQTGLSSTGRLHDLFIKIEAMTPGQYKSGGENLNIQYSFSNSPFGKIIIASTDIGVCHIAFEADEALAVSTLKGQFPNAQFTENTAVIHNTALQFFNSDWSHSDKIKLHLKGTDFQLKVWETLLTLPFGNLESYGYIAEAINKPNASRAVGTAIGKNPVAFLIPCHRVIQQSGNLGGYMWGETRKSAIIGWEASQLESV